MSAAVDDLRPPSEREFRLFQKLVYSCTGIHLGPTKRPLLNSRLSRRIRQLGLRSFGAYYDFVQEAGEAEQVELLDCITTNETAFFREPRHFAFLEKVIVPSWRSRPDGGTVRIWSAGCSTGEEPYSVAMALRHALESSRLNIEISATDLSTRALTVAATGEWPIARADAIPRPLLREFMLKGIGPNAGKFKASPDLRSMIRFARLNLNEGDFGQLPSPFDLILCRNVLIYFDRASKARVVERLIDRLAPGGYLFIGHAESLNGVTERVSCVEPTVYVNVAKERS